MPSPGVRIPTMRSPGTAPPLGANRTGKSVLMPRIGIAAPGSPGPFPLTDLPFLTRTQSPPSFHLKGLGFLEPEPAALLLRLLRDRGGPLLLVIGIHGAHDVGCAHLA